MIAAGLPFLSVEEEGKLGTVIRVTADQRDELVEFLRDNELAYTQLLDIFGADIEAREAVEADEEKGIAATPATAGYIEVTYFMRSMSADSDLRIKMQLPYESDYHSIIELFASAYLTERELCEMFGLVLLDHPNPKKLVTNQHFHTPLLKKVPIRGKEELWKRG
ncbi:MAG: NADH-quinone oxidoreductase subunit C [Actinomycetia bacterium]|nr:NADH-quinone oxidoreductase subunit C [Actinomycetes bacterium]